MGFQNVDEIEEALRSKPSIRDLYAAWKQRQAVAETARPKDGVTRRFDAPQLPWLQNPSLARLFTAKALEKEEFLLICDAAREALGSWQVANDNERIDLIRIRMDYAEALMRLGFTRRARNELEPFVVNDFHPALTRDLKVDILLQLGCILLEESHYATARAARLQSREEALAFYEQALELDPQRLEALGLSAAVTLVISEPNSALRQQARNRALFILTLVPKLNDAYGARASTTWAEAAAHTILNDTEAAAQCYSDLQKIEGVSTAQLAEARFHARFLAEAIGKPQDYFKAAFPPLQLIVFAGHLPDPTDIAARFPHELTEPVRELLRTKLQGVSARVGLVNAAAGADLLFIEALRARNGDVHLVLPWSQKEFRRTSVQPFDSPGRPPFWEPLFDAALREAATVREIGEVYEPGSPVGWGYLMEVTAGIAVHAARASRLDVQPMALWDGMPGRGAGGTESFVEFWRQQLQQEPILLPMPVIKDKGRKVIGHYEVKRCERFTMHQEVKSMLFADIVGYSKLHEQAIPDFVESFMGRVSQLAASSKHAPLSVNTWGDAVYAVFDFARDAGLFALEITQMVQEAKSDWLEKGLYWEEYRGENKEPIKHPLDVRIGLHTGPVVIHYDPLVRRLIFSGAHVNRAARIEPVAEPGEVFASEEFTALAELDVEIDWRRADKGGSDRSDGGAGFVCEYAGTMQLAKHYPGRFRIYRVLPKRIFAVEELAKTSHERYCIEAKARGETPLTNRAMRPWEELPEDLKDANRAQVADIPNKLRLIGYELASSHGLHPAKIDLSDAQIEELAIREHYRWMNDRVRHGWTYGPRRDDARKYHPLLIPWEELSEPEREKDRDTIRHLPRLIEKTGFRVRQIAAAGDRLGVDRSLRGLIGTLR
jgi:class 3 adenylate cyclase/tetratricopeptide (TPR) repeat protein